VQIYVEVAKTQAYIPHFFVLVVGAGVVVCGNQEEEK